jgi:hypothetical protein
MYDVMAEYVNRAIADQFPTVTSAHATDLGDISIELSNGMKIDIFPASSRRSESWRLFQRRGEHFVFPAEDDQAGEGVTP